MKDLDTMLYATATIMLLAFQNFLACSMALFESFFSPKRRTFPEEH